MIAIFIHRMASLAIVAVPMAVTISALSIAISRFMTVSVAISAMSVTMTFAIPFMPIAFAMTITFPVAISLVAPAPLIPIAGFVAMIFVVLMLMTVAVLSNIQAEAVRPDDDGGFPAAMSCLYFH